MKKKIFIDNIVKCLVKMDYDMHNESLHIILDNIDVIKVVRNIDSYYELSKLSGIPKTTISTWYTKSRQKKVYQYLKTLDILCDSLNIHTSDLFMPESEFTHEYSCCNNSMMCFRNNLNSICNLRGLITVKSRIQELFSCNTSNNFDSGKERYYSYFRQNSGRYIPIYQLDLLANKLEILTYQLLI